MRQRKLGSHTPPCHRRMVITTLFIVLLAYREGGGGGGALPGNNFGGENFVKGKFGHTSNFGWPGHQTPEGENFIRGQFCHTPSPWFLVDNQLCATVAGPNVERYHLNRDQKKEQDPGWHSILKEALAQGKVMMKVEFPQVHTVPALQVVPKLLIATLQYGVPGPCAVCATVASLVCQGLDHATIQIQL